MSLLGVCSLDAVSRQLFKICDFSFLFFLPPSLWKMGLGQVPCKRFWQRRGRPAVAWSLSQLQLTWDLALCFHWFSLVSATLYYDISLPVFGRTPGWPSLVTWWHAVILHNDGSSWREWEKNFLNVSYKGHQGEVPPFKYVKATIQRHRILSLGPFICKWSNILCSRFYLEIEGFPYFDCYYHFYIKKMIIQDVILYIDFLISFLAKYVTGKGSVEISFSIQVFIVLNL